MIASFRDSQTTSLSHWLAEYKANHREILGEDHEFARWLDEEYVPITGGWAY